MLQFEELRLELLKCEKPLTELAEGFKENQYYALAILERMYKGLHPEAYDDQHKGRIF